MKISLFLSLMLFCSLSGFSQQLSRENSVGSFSGNLDINKVENIHRVDNKGVSSEGSSYLFRNWFDQYILIFKNGDSRKISNLNYNLITKTLESSVSKDSVFQYDLDYIDYVIQSNNKYKVINDDKLNGLFLEVFNGINIKLFKETKVIINEREFNPLIQEKFEKAKYIQRDSYYFLVNGKYEKNKLEKKILLKYLNDKENLIKEFVSKNKLSYTSEEGVKKILNYYSLL